MIAFGQEFGHGILDHIGAVVALPGVTCRGLDADIGGDAADHEIADTHSGEHRFEPRPVEGAGA